MSYEYILRTMAYTKLTIIGPEFYVDIAKMSFYLDINLDVKDFLLVVFGNVVGKTSD